MEDDFGLDHGLTNNTITITSADGVVFESNRDAIKRSTFLNSVVEMDSLTTNINVNVSSPILTLIIEYLNHHETIEPTEIEKPLREPTQAELFTILNDWEKEYIQKIDNHTLIELVKSANYLYIAPLLDLICATIATKIAGKTKDQILQEFPNEYVHSTT
jgi:S-phase kinase-associated protein 1